MSVVENKAKLRYWFVEVVNGKTSPATFLAAADEVLAPNFVDHDGPDPANGREAIKKAVPGLLKAVPDLRITIEQLFGEGDLVCIRVRGEATHTGEVMGIAPTGKRISWTENEIFRFEAGRIAESWGEGNLDEALAEVGFGFGARKS